LLLWADFNSLFTVTIRNDKRNISGINSAILGWGRGEDNINGITKQQRIISAAFENRKNGIVNIGNIRYFDINSTILLIPKISNIAKNRYRFPCRRDIFIKMSILR